MKDLSIEIVICRIDENNPIGVKEGDIFTQLVTDSLNIFGSLQILTLDEKKDLGIHIVSIDNDIYIPAEHHPYIQNDGCSYPLFVEERMRVWNPELVAGEYYIMSTKVGMKQLVLIRSISIDKIEYDECTSRYDKKNGIYVVETIAHELTIDYSVGYKFTPLKKVTCRL